MQALFVGAGGRILFNKHAIGIDLAKKIDNGIYWIGNLKEQAINPPSQVSTACIILSCGRCDLIIGCDGKYFCGRYNLDGSAGEWTEIAIQPALVRTDQ